MGTPRKLNGIVAAIETLEYFYAVATSFVTLQKIELANCELMRLSVDPPTLEDCIERVPGRHYRSLGRKLRQQLDELSLNDYVMILRHGDDWEHISEPIGDLPPAEFEAMYYEGKKRPVTEAGLE